MPLWWGRVNKRVFNPRAVRSGRWALVHHVGRTSGRSYQTPVDAHVAGDDVVVTLVYGSGADWVRNVLAAGRATVEVDGDTVEVVDPRVVTTDEAFARLPPTVKRPPRLLRIDEHLLLRRADAG